MTVTAQRFLKAFPEFKETELQLINQKIALATLRTNETVWDDLYEDGIMMLTAHLLSVSPMGEKSRMVKDDRDTMYWRELTRMRREVTAGYGRYT